MNIVAFDDRNKGACPGCGIFDNGNHIQHRYDSLDGSICTHNNHAALDCPKLKTREKRFQKWLRIELEKGGNQ